MTTEQCRCPNRPYLGSMARGSQMEGQALDRWQDEHGHHPFAKARDVLASYVQVAETAVRRGEQDKAGAAVLDMVHDILGAERPVSAHSEDVATAEGTAAQMPLAPEPQCPNSPACVPGCAMGGARAWHSGSGPESSHRPFTRADVLLVLRAMLASKGGLSEAILAFEDLE